MFTYVDLYFVNFFDSIPIYMFFCVRQTYNVFVFDKHVSCVPAGSAQYELSRGPGGPPRAAQGGVLMAPQGVVPNGATNDRQRSKIFKHIPNISKTYSTNKLNIQKKGLHLLQWTTKLG